LVKALRKGERKELASGVHTAAREERLRERAVKWAERLFGLGRCIAGCYEIGPQSLVALYLLTQIYLV
jgi:hypothetical protein